MSARVGPEEMNSRPARPSSSQRSREALLPVFRGSVGGSVSGLISSSYSWKDASATRRATRKRTPLMTDQNSATAAMTPMTLDTRLGRRRLTLIATSERQLKEPRERYQDCENRQCNQG